MVPLGQAIASVMLGETREQVADLTNFSRTTQSYRELMWGQADLLISGAPPQGIYDEKEENGFEWDISLFAVDGLVFVVNESNPVDNLTTEQIQGIYSGKITNWKEVGGDDVEIVPFQRNEEAGSQTAMRKLVMGDIPLMEAPAEYVSGAMGDLVKVVASYNDSAAAIGYTVYYYAHDMKMADGLKIIAVDGVQPSAETIRSREYPFINDSYVVIKAGLPDDDPAKILYDWILSDEGQRLVAHEGYVSIRDVG
jgi:phosphate transport system substrate-binding protein